MRLNFLLKNLKALFLILSAFEFFKKYIYHIGIFIKYIII